MNDKTEKHFTAMNNIERALEMDAKDAHITTLESRVRELEDELKDMTFNFSAERTHHDYTMRERDESQAVVRELDSLDNRIKIAFAEMWLESNCEERIASAECYKLEGALTARFIDGERTESLLGEMQALTKEMSK